MATLCGNLAKIHHRSLFGSIKTLPRPTLLSNVSPIFPSRRIFQSSPHKDVSMNKQGLNLKELLPVYASLAKFRLSSLVVATTMVGYWMAPGTFDLVSFAATTVGTSLAVCSANTFNQIIEIDRDAQMKRTLKRILPTGKISITHAFMFGAVTGLSGVALLAFQVNPLTSLLAFSNIILYTLVYTPTKVIHPINTWIGSFVGAIPPMIGWAAQTGSLELGAWVLGTLLYVWQIPHFLSLSWLIRNDYEKAGYKMLSVTHKEKVAPITLRYSVYLLPMGMLCAISGMTTSMFAIDSLLIDGYLIWNSYKFYKESNNENARKAFFSTLVYLPLFMALMMFHKKAKVEDKKEETTTKEVVESQQQTDFNESVQKEMIPSKDWMKKRETVHDSAFSPPSCG